MKRKWTSFLLCAAMLSTMLAGCGGKTSSEGTKTEGNVSDKLVYAQGTDPRGLDPALVDDSESSKLICQIYEGLLKYAKDSTEVEPALAKSWDISADGLEYTFHLQEGVKFHDGTPFNAEAVKYNVERQTTKATEDMSYAGFVYGDVTACEVVDEHTVKMTLRKVCTPFLNNLAMSLAAPMVSPTACDASKNNMNEAPVGTGPYKFVRWDKSEAVVMERFDDYWGEKAKAKDLIFKIIADKSTRVIALTNGEVDIIDGIDTTVVDQIKQGGCQIFQTEGMNINYLAYNTKKMVDPEVRKALSQSVNVPELVKSIFQGYATEATTILPSFIPGYSKDVKQTAYDPEAAKATLAAKGITEVKMMTYTNPGAYNQTLAEAVQAYYSKVGVKATIDAYDWTTYKEKLKSGDYDLCFYGWNGDNGDADNFMYILTHEDPTMNVSLYSNATYNTLLEKAASTPNGEERNAIYKEMEQLIANDNVWQLISHIQTISGYGPTVKNYSCHKTGNIFLSQTYKEK